MRLHRASSRGRDGVAMNLLKSFLSRLFGIVVAIRNFLYDRGIIPSYHSSLPIISVGNITAGGNGKTPLVMFLAEELKARGSSPVILSRGYGGAARGPRIVKIDDTADLVGDEAVLMRKRLSIPVVISRRRVRGAKLIERQQLGDIIILDDGFQHRRLHRDIDIVAVNSATDWAIEEFLEGKLLPEGMFRESLEPALKRADVLVFSDRKPLSEKREIDRRLLDLVPENVQVYKSSVIAKEIKSLSGDGRPSGQDVLVVTAIANPESFLLTLKGLGLGISAVSRFPDHYRFKIDDFSAIRSRFPGLPILVTEKDAVKLDERFGEDIYFLAIDCIVTPSDAFLVQIQKTLMKRRKIIKHQTVSQPRVDSSETGVRRG